MLIFQERAKLSNIENRISTLSEVEVDESKSENLGPLHKSEFEFIDDSRGRFQIDLETLSLSSSDSCSDETGNKHQVPKLLISKN